MFLKVFLKEIHDLNALKSLVLALLLTVVSLLCGYATADEPKPAAGITVSVSKLNDTGITWGGDYPKDINEDCSAEFNPQQIKEFEKLKQLVPNDSIKGDILSQQDCKHGRDATANDSSDGDAGFVYRKVSSKGKILDASAKSWDCTLDEVTGLLWEVKKDMDGIYGNRGLHDGDDLFTWYNPNVTTNGGLLGDWNSESKQCAGYQAGQFSTFCNMEEFAVRANQQGLCGFKDWRVPTLTELVTLVHYGRSNPSIDTGYFPHMDRELLFWSNTPSASAQDAVWALSLQYGLTASMRYTDNYRVVLVRNWTAEAKKSYSQARQLSHSGAGQKQQTCRQENMAATTPTARFKKHDDGTVTDLDTRLMWRVCVEGLKGKDCEKGKALELSWGGALVHVPELNNAGGFAGYKDWRVPNIRELATLLELQCVRPAINLEIFPNMQPGHAWSSSPYHFYTHYSWYVDFDSGQINTIERIKPKQLRLVRGGN